MHPLWTYFADVWLRRWLNTIEAHNKSKWTSEPDIRMSMNPEKPNLKIHFGWFVRTIKRKWRKKLKHEEKMPVNTPTNWEALYWKMIIMRLHAIGHFEHWIIYLWYKWMNVFGFELKVINEKCHSLVCSISFFFTTFFFFLFLSNSGL